MRTVSRTLLKDGCRTLLSRLPASSNDRYPFPCAKTVLHVSDRSGRRCALHFASFGRRFPTGGWHRALGSGDFLVDPFALSSAGNAANAWVPDTLRLCHQLSHAVRCGHPFWRPQQVSPPSFHPEQWGCGAARTRCLLHRCSHLWPPAFDRTPTQIKRMGSEGFRLAFEMWDSTNLNLQYPWSLQTGALRAAESHISQTTSEIWGHPLSVGRWKSQRQLHLLHSRPHPPPPGVSMCSTSPLASRRLHFPGSSFTSVLPALVSHAHPALPSWPPCNP